MPDYMLDETPPQETEDAWDLSWDNVLAWLQDYGLSILMVVVGALIVFFILSKIIDIIASNNIKKHTSNGIEDEQASKKTKDVGNIAKQIVGAAVFLISLIIVLAGVFNMWDDVESWLGEIVLPIVLISVIALVIYAILKKIIAFWVKQSVTRNMAGSLEIEINKRVKTLTSFTTNIMTICIVIIALVAILGKVFDINVGAIVAGLGVVGLGISLAMQSLIKDILNGFFIMIDEYYQIGDSVTIGDLSGTVESIDLRKTVLRDLSGVVHIIPNSNVNTASNSTKGFSRINLNISVSYQQDLTQAIAVINEIGANLAKDPKWKKEILNTPYVLRIDKLGDSGIDIKITGDTKPGMQNAVMGELRMRIKDEFDKRNIEIPFSSQTTYFGNVLPTSNSNSSQDKND